MKKNIDTILNIQDDICWRCSKKFENNNKTSHHGIPVALNPKRNVIIPICKNCHAELNTIDYSILQSYMFKIKYDTQELNKNINRLSAILENTSEMQQKLDNALKKNE